MNTEIEKKIREIKEQATEAKQEAWKEGLCAICDEPIPEIRRKLGSYTCSKEHHLEFYNKYDYSQNAIKELKKKGPQYKRVKLYSWELAAAEQDNAVLDMVGKKIERALGQVSGFEIAEPVEPVEVVLYMGAEKYDWSHEKKGIFQVIFDMMGFRNLVQIEIWESNGSEFVYRETRKVKQTGISYDKYELEEI